MRAKARIKTVSNEPTIAINIVKLALYARVIDINLNFQVAKARIKTVSNEPTIAINIVKLTFNFLAPGNY